jgi:flagellar motor switch protein FliN/FliY
MTEAADPINQPEPFQHLQAWAESFAQVLGQIGGTPFPCAALAEAPAGLAPATESDLWMVCTCSGGLRGELSLRLPASSVLRLAQIFMSEPPAPEASLTPEHREAAVELLRQVAGLVATAVKARWGEVQLRVDPAAGAPSWSPATSFWLRVGEDSPTPTLVEAQLSAALGAGLRSEKTEVQAPVVTPDATVLPVPEDSSVKLDLLMDVELAVTLRFGSRCLLLRDVLDLGPGAVIELDRQVEDPVDALLDGRLLARGEVVVVDGNYALRVTEVAPASAV